MPPSFQDDSKTITGDQVRLICEFAEASPNLTPAEWEKLANTLGIRNGKAAKERWRYLINSLSERPTKSNRPAAKSKSAVKTKTKAPSVPAKKPVKRSRPNYIESDISEASEHEEQTPVKIKHEARQLVTPAPTPRSMSMVTARQTNPVNFRGTLEARQPSVSSSFDFNSVYNSGEAFRASQAQQVMTPITASTNYNTQHQVTPFTGNTTNANAPAFTPTYDSFSFWGDEI